MMIARLSALSLLVVLTFATTATAQSNSPSNLPADQAEQQIVLLLSGYDYFPSRAKIESVSANAPEILIAISKDKARLPSLRSRAIDALGLFAGHPRVAQHFEATLAAGQLDEVALRHSLTSSLKAFGDRALPWVAPYLDHKDPVVRLDAAHAIGRLGGVDGAELIRTRTAVERDDFVRAQLFKLDRQGIAR
jgi:HEAT repeat protein